MVDGVGVDEGDGEASRCELDGQMDGRDYVTLKWVGEEYGVRAFTMACF